MGRALYRTYRSKKLSEIVGQEHITSALSTALASNRISHAYLFTGPRGIGKTSIARILAHEVNNLPYDESETHLDIIEIDAASNRRIDEVRDLREKVHVAPTSAKYKVYIIDEVHMLTREAFNALLKTLEEPPAHVIFILATTEAHKLPETIISRTQHFAFKPIDTDKAVAHLADIAKKEKISIDTDALTLIAKHGGGSFRDSISLLDQIRNASDKITSHDVQAMLGITSDEVVSNILDALVSKDVKKIVTILKSQREQGIDTAILAKQLAAAIRESIVTETSTNPSEMSLLLEKLIEVPTSADPYAALEVRLLQFALHGESTTNHTAEKPKPENTDKKKDSPKPKVQKDAESTTKKADTSKQKQKTTPSKVSSDTIAKKITPDQWSAVVDEIKHTHNTLYGVLRMAQPSFDDRSVTLTLAFAFHQKRLNEPKNRQVIADAIEKVCGAHLEIHCVVGVVEREDAPINDESLPNVPAAEDTNSLGTISNIFGGGELLES